MSLIIESYSDKAIVVRGETKLYKEHLKKLGGLFNDKLKGGPGWIYSNSKRSSIEDFNNQIKEGKVEQLNSSSQSSFQQQKTSTFSHTTDNHQYVSIKEYLGLLSRVERLEQIVANKNTESSSKNEITFEEDSDEENEVPKVHRLLKR